jgi:hypothetical protein
VDGRCWTFSCLEGLPSNTSAKKCLYLEAHASNGLFSALSAEIKDEIKMEYGWSERANLLWKVLEQMYDSSNSKKSSSAPENISSSFTHFDQDQEEQSSVRKEELNFATLGNRWSGFLNRRVRFWENRKGLI